MTKRKTLGRSTASARRDSSGKNMHKPDLRRHQRILVPSGHIMRIASTEGPKLEGAVTVIGLGGMFVRTNRPSLSGPS